MRRDSGIIATPDLMAARGDDGRKSRPLSSIVPEVGLVAPNTVRATSVRPEPTSPARVTISPARTSIETSANSPSRVSRSRRRTGPASAGTAGAAG